MSKKPLWVPSVETIKASHLAAFQKKVRDDLGLEFDTYQQLHRWSVDHPSQFWAQIWDYGQVRASRTWDSVIVESDEFYNTQWFSGSRLNFAENLLRNRNDKVALVARMENGSRRTLTYAELYKQVKRCAAALRQYGVVSGDRVAGFMPNVPESVVAMLATASIGATWSSCSPDFGIHGVIDRFGQIEPKVLFACDGYFYNGKIIDSLPRVQGICERINSIEQLVITPLVNSSPNLEALPQAVLIDNFIPDVEPEDLEFEQLPFHHPLYILYSSGTTGVPKCIVHSAGGALLQHLKEHQLHTDLKPEDVFFFYSTCGWMMWNWLVSGLASEATLVLYDGSPFYPGPATLIDMAEEESISIFGVSAKYLVALEKAHVVPRKTHNLEALRAVLSTASPLSAESFRYVYREFKESLTLASISGGTDILSGFVEGNVCLPVWEGEIQCLALGMAVEIWNAHGESVTQEKGELVCTQPFPSTPLYFWNDDDNKRYKHAYFDTYPGVWTQGDYGEITEHGGMIIYGRSDALLNPGGVRIGTAEIYRQVEKIDAVMDSVCIGQAWNDDVRVVLFVVLREGLLLTDALKQAIQRVIREETTPRHVPAKILSIADIPRTISGKVVELAVRQIVHNEGVKNSDALANPEALKLFEDLPELQC